MPPKPQDVIIERWLPLPPRQRRIIYERLPAPAYHQQASSHTDVNQLVQQLGVNQQYQTNVHTLSLAIESYLIFFLCFI